MNLPLTELPLTLGNNERSRTHLPAVRRVVEVRAAVAGRGGSEARGDEEDYYQAPDAGDGETSGRM